MPNKLPSREIRNATSTDRIPRSHESLYKSQNFDPPAAKDVGGTTQLRHHTLHASTTDSASGIRRPSSATSTHVNAGSSNSHLVGNNNQLTVGSALSLAPAKTAATDATASATSRSRLYLGARSHESLAASNATVASKSRSFETLNHNKPPPTTTTTTTTTATTTTTTANTSSNALHGLAVAGLGNVKSKNSLAESKEMLGSSFQLSHVVPEVPEEEERVPTRVPSSISATTAGTATMTVRNIAAAVDVAAAAAAAGAGEADRVGDSGGDSSRGALPNAIAEEDEDEERMQLQAGGGASSARKSTIGRRAAPQETHTVQTTAAMAEDIMQSQESLLAMNVGAVGSSDRMEVVFRDLCFDVPVASISRRRRKRVADGAESGGETRRRILKGIDGVFRPGRLTVIMGASGAGKTSLLNVIAGETTSGEVSGKITINGQEVHTSEIRDLSGFVFQDDVILPTSTVREAIWMSALLRLPQGVTMEERTQRVDEMISSLNLHKAANTIVGDSQIKGISGGERKRCAMAMEMLSKPAVLFLDEPTSGLDSFTALSVIKTLKGLAATGRTVIATLHQPSSEIFRLFDDLILMANGRIMYQGPAKDSVQYFARHGYLCPKMSNPTDYFFMSILNVNDDYISEGQNDGLTSSQRISKLLDAWDASPELRDLRADIENSPHKGGITKAVLKGHSSAIAQFTFLFSRASKNAIRNPLVLRSKVIQTTFICILVGLLYLNTNQLMSLVGAQNRIGVLFFICVTNLMTSSNANLTVFGREKSVFLREHRAGYYSVFPYFTGKFLAELPLYIVFPGLQTIILYYMVGLQPGADKVLYALVSSIMSSLVGMSLGIFFACVFSTLQVALTAVPLVIMPLMLFSGLFVNTAAMPKWIAWLQYLSPIKYSFEALLKNEFNTLVYPISTPRGTVMFHGTSQVDAMGFSDDGLDVYICILLLLGFTLCLITGAYFSLARLVKVKEKRHSGGKVGAGRKDAKHGGPV